MFLEMLLLIGVLLFYISVAAAQTGKDKPWAAAPIAATVTVEAPSRDLPSEIAVLELEVNELGPLPLRELVGRIADLAGVEASIQERPGRVEDGDVAMAEPVPFGLSMRGSIVDVLDEVARLSGYDWGWEGGRLLFYRYADIDQRRAERVPGGVPVELLAAVAQEEGLEEVPAVEADEVPAVTKETVDAEGRSETGVVAAEVPGKLEPGGRAVDSEAVATVEGQGETPAQGAVPAQPADWEVIPDEHGTVEDVLRAWAVRAGWQLAWDSEQRFTVGAAAAFPAGESEEAGFLAAADALLAIGPMRRALSATAYPNRWLVIRDIGSAVQ